VLRRCALTLFFVAATTTCYCAHGEDSTLGTVHQLRQLTSEQVAQAQKAAIRGVVTYYEPAEHILFVEDSTGAIFIRTTRTLEISKGDLVEVRGVTAGSYGVVIVSDDIRVVGTGPLPNPKVATFPELMSGRWDCAYVTITGTIRAATEQQTIGEPFLLLEVLMDGGYIEAHVEQPQGLNLESLLDTQVTLTGVAGGAFDGKFQLVGVVIYLSSPKDMHIVSPQPMDPAKLPLTRIDRVMAAYNMLERRDRVRARGSVTLYEPGTRLVIENEGRALLVHTHERTPLRLGNVVDAIGFPDANDYSQSLSHGQFLETPYFQPINARPVTWDEALSGQYAFNLVSLEGKVVAEVHERQQDTLVLDTDGHVFSAVLRHVPWAGAVPVAELPNLSIESRVRVTGVCITEAGGPWNNAIWFEIHLRDAADVALLARPSWWTVSHLVYVVGGLLVAIVAALAWGAMLRRRVRYQTGILRRTMQEEAARERRQAFLEKERSRVLEAINSSMPLDQVLQMITDFISEQRSGVLCWCELVAERTIGSAIASQSAPRVLQIRRELYSSSGKHLGAIILAKKDESGPEILGGEVLDIGASLAALAIDNRRLYEGLIHRSEYDQLTEVPNRFLLEARLTDALEKARKNGHRLALIYIDLDRFKYVNDRYGHRVGDEYLQAVARRLSDKLRGHDTLARVGGDEFIALIPVVEDKSEAEEIALRLNRCFRSPFRIDDLLLHGSASIGLAVYPEDGEDQDQLKRIADGAMYAVKLRLSG
jgi:diguanylate cyclase (GGDEF)-like protein